MRPKEILQRWVEYFNQYDYERLGELYAEGCINHQTPNGIVIHQRPFCFYYNGCTSGRYFPKFAAAKFNVKLKNAVDIKSIILRHLYLFPTFVILNCHEHLKVIF